MHVDEIDVKLAQPFNFPALGIIFSTLCTVPFSMCSLINEERIFDIPQTRLPVFVKEELIFSRIQKGNSHNERERNIKTRKHRLSDQKGHVFFNKTAPGTHSLEMAVRKVFHVSRKRKK